MALFLAAAVLTVILALAGGLAVFRHRRKRERRSMRDHLNRISQAGE